MTQTEKIEEIINTYINIDRMADKKDAMTALKEAMEWSRQEIIEKITKVFNQAKKREDRVELQDIITTLTGEDK